MSSSNAGNVNGFWKDANPVPLDSIFETTVATHCESQCRNFRLMHWVSVGSDVHDGVSRESVIRIGNDVVETSQRVCGSQIVDFRRPLCNLAVRCCACHLD